MFLAGTFLLFARTLWAYATIAEVYALNTFLIAAIVWLILRWRRTRLARDLYLSATLFGLALGVHHVTVGLMLVGIAVFVVMTAGPRFLISREVLICAVLAIAALIAVYAYLPFAASRNAALNWGDPSNAKLTWQHVSGAQFRGFIKSSPSAQAAVITTLITREFGPRAFPVAGLLAIGGLIAMARRDRALLMMTILGIAGCCAWMMVYPIQTTATRICCRHSS